MSFKKHVNYGAASKGKRPSVRFRDGVAYLSIGFMERASRLLVTHGTLDEGDTIRYVELWFDSEERKIGINPVGHRGLSDAILVARTGVRRISGNKNHVVSASSFQREYDIPDGVKILLDEVQVAYDSKKGLPAGEDSFTLFAGAIPLNRKSAC